MYKQSTCLAFVHTSEPGCNRRKWCPAVNSVHLGFPARSIAHRFRERTYITRRINTGTYELLARGSGRNCPSQTIPWNSTKPGKKPRRHLDTGTVYSCTSNQCALLALWAIYCLDERVNASQTYNIVNTGPRVYCTRGHCVLK